MTNIETLLLAWLDGDVAAGYALSDLLEEQGQGESAVALRALVKCKELANENDSVSPLKKLADFLRVQQEIDRMRQETFRRGAYPQEQIVFTDNTTTKWGK